MKKCLILHGRAWKAESNWFPWLKGEMESKWYEVFLHDLPNSKVPSYDEQMSFIEWLNFDLGEWNIIFWHSLWCKLAINYIDRNNLRGLKVFLVAPVYPWLVEEAWRDVFWKAYDSILEYINKENNFQVLWNKYVAFLSSDDQYIDMWKSKKYLNNLEDIQFVEFENMWHFNEWSWITKLKELFEY